MQLFVSYSRRDAGFAALLAGSLEARGHSVWIDAEDIVASGEDRWRRSIVNGIAGCDAMLLVLSPNSVTSQNVEREVTVAAEMKKRIALVVHQPCELPAGLLYELAGVQRIDFTQQPHEEAVLQLDRFLRQLGSQPRTAAVPTTSSDQSPGSPPAAFPPPPPTASPQGHRSRTALIGVGVGLVAAIILIAALTSGGNGDGSSDPTSPTAVTDTQTNTPVTQPTSTEPSTTIAISQQAEGIVTDWAAETTARNWDAVRAISVPEQGKDLDSFNSFYGAPDAAKHLETLNAYIAGATVQSDVVLVQGAVFAWDYFEDPRVVGDPPISTNIGCRQWVVDVGTGTILSWTLAHDPGLSGGERLYELHPESDFPGLYATYCHAGG